MAAAVTRATCDGHVLGAGEAVRPERALRLFLGAAGDPGGPPRRVAPGAEADLCLLHVPLDEALRRPNASAVRLVVVGGRILIPAD